MKETRKACEGGPVREVWHEMAGCDACGTAVRWDLQDDPFFGFQTCDRKGQADEEEDDDRCLVVAVSAHQDGRMSRHHELKTWPEYFVAVQDGSKTFELRLDDRDFTVGDVLWLREWERAGGYTGRTVTRTVSYVLSGHGGLVHGYAILGLVPEPPK